MSTGMVVQIEMGNSRGFFTKRKEGALLTCNPELCTYSQRRRPLVFPRTLLTMRRTVQTVARRMRMRWLEGKEDVVSVWWEGWILFFELIGKGSGVASARLTLPAHQKAPHLYSISPATTQLYTETATAPLLAPCFPFWAHAWPRRFSLRAPIMISCGLNRRDRHILTHPCILRRSLMPRGVSPSPAPLFPTRSSSQFGRMLPPPGRLPCLPNIRKLAIRLRYNKVALPCHVITPYSRPPRTRSLEMTTCAMVLPILPARGQDYQSAATSASLRCKRAQRSHDHTRLFDPAGILSKFTGIRNGIPVCYMSRLFI